MNGKKAKEIRRVLKEQLEKGSYYSWIAHPSTYTNMNGETMLKFKLQYVVNGGLRLYKTFKKIYRLYGVIPKVRHG